MSRARPSVAGAALRAEVETPQGIWSAGLGFAVTDPRCPAHTYVSCLHLLGPAGGLPVPLAPAAFFPDAVPIVDAYDRALLALSTGLVDVPRATAEVPWRDILALQLPPLHGCHLYVRRREAASAGEQLNIAAPPRDGRPPWVHPATVERAVGPLFTVRLQSPDTSPRGWSGAPVLDARARWVGMLVRGSTGSAVAVHASAVVVQLRHAYAARVTAG